MDNFIKYVNSTMSEINDICDEIYESLVDKDFEITVENCNKLIRTLKDIKKSCTDL